MFERTCVLIFAVIKLRMSGREQNVATSDDAMCAGPPGRQSRYLASRNRHITAHRTVTEPRHRESPPPSSSTSTKHRSAPRPLPSPPAMDRLESLGNAISQISIYDIKSMYNQVCEDRYRPVRHHSCPLPGEECGVQCQRDGSESPGCDQRRTMVRAVTLRCAKRMLKASRGASSTLMQEIAQVYVTCLLQ